MANELNSEIRDLFERISRINAADEWAGDLNPTQMAALAYLAKANRFSRSPSQVAEYLSATRGTVSQTLKALARKGLINEARSDADRRSISYDVTDVGRNALILKTVVDQALEKLDEAVLHDLAASLRALIRTVLATRGKRPFGICRDCCHHRKRGRGGYCALLDETLSPDETGQICHEYQAAA